MSIQPLHLTRPAMSVSGSLWLTHAGRAGELVDRRHGGTFDERTPFDDLRARFRNGTDV
jgi:hypothetical protein